MPTFHYSAIDVFESGPLTGNPVAVVHAAAALDAAQMAALARWTNLSETTFLLPPTDAAAADYRLRIWTPHRELPFAGHPTLGSCHAWLAAGGRPRGADVVQQCELGLIRIRRDGERLAFAAPPRQRTGPLDAALLDRLARALHLAAADVSCHQWVDNGPGWCALQLPSAAAVLAVEPDWPALEGLMVGLTGAHAAGEDAQFEVRALVGEGSGYEDPVTGSLNASLAQWLTEAGVAPARYVVAQGTRLGRAGRVHVERVGDDVWIGGRCATQVDGTLTL